MCNATWLDNTCWQQHRTTNESRSWLHFKVSRHSIKHPRKRMLSLRRFIHASCSALHDNTTRLMPAAAAAAFILLLLLLVAAALGVTATVMFVHCNTGGGASGTLVSAVAGTGVLGGLVITFVLHANALASVVDCTHCAQASRVRH